MKRFAFLSVALVGVIALGQQWEGAGRLKFDTVTQAQMPSLDGGYGEVLLEGDGGLWLRRPTAYEQVAGPGTITTYCTTDAGTAGILSWKYPTAFSTTPLACWCSVTAATPLVCGSTSSTATAANFLAVTGTTQLISACCQGPW